MPRVREDEPPQFGGRQELAEGIGEENVFWDEGGFDRVRFPAGRLRPNPLPGHGIRGRLGVKRNCEGIAVVGLFGCAMGLAESLMGLVRNRTRLR